MPADSSTNCRRSSTTSNEPWRSGLISERRIRSSSYAASFQGAACTVGDLGQLPFFGRSAASKGLGQTRSPCDRFPVCRVSVSGEPLACGFPSSFVMPMRSQTVKRGKAPDRPLRGGCRVVLLTRQWRFCAKYQVNASLGERSRSRFPDEGGIGYRGGLRTARVYHPQCGRMPRQSATMPISGRKDAGSSPHSRPPPPTLGEMCASFTGIKYTFHCAAIKCERSAMFFPRKTPETWYKHLFQNYRFAYFGAFVSNLY